MKYAFKLGRSETRYVATVTNFFSSYFVEHLVECAVPEDIHTPPHRRDWNPLGEEGGGGVRKAKTFKEMCEA